MTDRTFNQIAFLMFCGACLYLFSEPLMNNRSTPQPATSQILIASPSVQVPPLALPVATLLDPNDPTVVDKKFQERIEADIKKISQSIKTKPLPPAGGTGRFSAECTGVYAYDIQKTNSVVTPFIGYVNVNIRWFYNGELVQAVQHIRYSYSYQRSEWVPKSGRRDVDEEKVFRYPTDVIPFDNWAMSLLN